MPQFETIGKRVGAALYLHISSIPKTDDVIGHALNKAISIACLDRDQFNVVKLQGEPIHRVSLLAYDEFEENAFPALQDSWTVDIKTKSVSHRSYKRSTNPPILHRKELLLPEEDEQRELYSRLTKVLENRGLFEDAKSIGFRRQWKKRLADNGIKIHNHEVVELGEEQQDDVDETQTVNRHKTAIGRGKLSTPMQALARHGLVDEDRSILDYGCGRGNDIEILQATGLNATGWDPHYRPNAPLEEADIVNLGYVINVIEKPGERLETIAKAFELTKQCLAIAVIPAGRTSMETLRPFGDGYLSTKGTFQKYFSQTEIRQLIEEATSEEAIAIAPGLFFVFRDKVEEQRFLSTRSRQRRDISHLLAVSPPTPTKPTPHEQTLLEEYRELIDAYWGRALELGRLPVTEEVDPDIHDEIQQIFGSIRKITRLAQQVHDPATLSEAKDARTDDLRVYFAMNIFNKRRRYRELPGELQRDVKAFFGSHGNADDSGRALLFSLGQPQTIHDACREAEAQGLGHLFGDHSLQLHASLITRLPAVLRAYVGCAEKMFGEINEESTDLIKIHINSGKLTLTRYKDFDRKPLPLMTERIKIKMANQDIDFFDYASDGPKQLLTLKSRYMLPIHKGYKRQRSFDRALEAVGLFDLDGYGLSVYELAEGLESRGLTIKGFKLVSESA